MSITLTVRDETASGDVFNELPLEFPSERITVRELIRGRVYQEVQDFNRKKDERSFRGLVQPTDSERILNNSRAEYRLSKKRELDWKEQFNRAIKAFNRNGFFVLIGGKQAESLDQEVIIGHTTPVSFVKLVPLVGG
jgi:hypothetical protein